jgi:hypothetical protein
MILALALLMVPAQPVELPTDTKPATTVVIAAVAPPAATIQPRNSVMPDAPSETIASTEADPDPSLVTAPRVLSPALIMNPVTTPTRKKSVGEEHPTSIKYWRGLTIASSSAAAFDAWTTRRNINTGRFKEENTWLKPFAGNASLYAVMQVRPVLFDYVGRRMFRSNKKWVRNLWWVPQTAQTAANFYCGAKNMSLK